MYLVNGSRKKAGPVFSLATETDPNRAADAKRPLMTKIVIGGAGLQMRGLSPFAFEEPQAPHHPPLSDVNGPGEHYPPLSQQTPETAPEEPDNGPNRQSSPLNCKQGHFRSNARRGKLGQPLLTRLSLHDDKIKVWVDFAPGTGETIDTTRPGYQLLNSDKRKTLSFGKFTLVPEGFGAGLCSRLYIVHHSDHSDPVGKLHTHPQRGRKSRGWLHLENHLHYIRQSVSVGIELLDALGTYSDGLSEYEVAGDALEVLEIAKFIHDEKLRRKNKGFCRIEVNGAGTVKGMQVNKPTSDRFARIYSNGTTLNRRNRQYIADGATRAGVIEPGAGKTLARLEFKIKSKEAARLEYKGKRVTLRTLQDPAARLAIFRGQIETGFVFRFSGSTTDIPFFDWEAIADNYGREFAAPLTDDGEAVAATVRKPRTARKSNATYGAKQAIRKLVKDSGRGDYLGQVLRPVLEHDVKVTLLQPDRIKALTDTLSGAGCGLPDDMTRELITAFVTDAAGDLAGDLAQSLPRTVARAIAGEHKQSDYLRRQLYIQSQQPQVNRPPETLTSLSPALCL